MNFLDAYVIRARLFPAILAISPFIALAAIMVSWDKLSLPQTITTVAVGVLLFAFSDLARRLGKHAEKRLFPDSGGMPSNWLLRPSDKTFDETTKDRYRKIVGELIGEEAPSNEKDLNDPAAADGYYVRVSNYLREHTRDKVKFRLLFEENITYGFRRNLYGIKWPALALNLLVLVICGVLLYLNNFAPRMLRQVEMIGVFAAVHALYFFLVVNKRSVLAASEQYARQLILSSETLHYAEPEKKKKG